MESVKNWPTTSESGFFWLGTFGILAGFYGAIFLGGIAFPPAIFFSAVCFYEALRCRAIKAAIDTGQYNNGLYRVADGAAEMAIIWPPLLAVASILAILLIQANSPLFSEDFLWGYGAHPSILVFFALGICFLQLGQLLHCAEQWRRESSR